MRLSIEYQGTAWDSDIRVFYISLLLVFLYSPVSGPDGSSIVEIIIKVLIRHVSFLFLCVCLGCLSPCS